MRRNSLSTFPTKALTNSDTLITLPFYLTRRTRMDPKNMESLAVYPTCVIS